MMDWEGGLNPMHPCVAKGQVGNEVDRQQSPSSNLPQISPLSPKVKETIREMVG